MNKESAAIRRLHEIKVRVAAEYLRPQPRQHVLPSQQPKKGPRHNNEKELRTPLIKTPERTGVTNKHNVQSEMTLMTVDQRALVTADPAALRHQQAFFGHATTINEHNAQSLLHRNSGNRLLVY